MTETGRRFFINCVCYIQKFDGHPPLVHPQSSHRMNSIRLAALITRIKDKSFFRGVFPAELMAEYKDDPDGLVKYYEEDIELIYRARTFQIDQELKALGFASNRQLETLAGLIKSLDDPERGEATRRLLARYTEETFDTGEQWRDWLEAGRGRIYFSDVGGYKFRVMPEGYPVPPGHPSLAVSSD
jgi:hypothetical protein